MSSVPWKILLGVSLGLNVLLIGLALKKRMNALIHRLSPAIPSPHYDHRKSLFSLMTPTQRDIVFLGDSITEGCNWSELFRNPRIKNRGIGGDTSDGVLKRLNQIIAGQPQQVFLMVGINDLWNGDPVENVAENIRQILACCKRTSPATKVFIQSVLPMNGTWSSIPKRIPTVNARVVVLNNKLRALASEFQQPYIDLHSLFSRDDQLDPNYTHDGLHLNGTAYMVWKSAIENLVATNP
ncbi:MAG: GDSL-type esterase/lipase family protein [Bacteroidota bacterium]